MSKRKASSLSIGIVCLYFAAGATILGATELRFRSEAQVSGGLVRLGDVADIFASDLEEAQRLANVELFPAPAPGEKRYVRVKEIQDMLRLRNVNLAQHSFSGASRITVLGSDDAAGGRRSKKAVSPMVRRKAEERVARLIADYLDTERPNSAPWRVQPDLGEVQAQRIAAASAIAVVGERTSDGGSPQFLLDVTTRRGTEQIAVVADAGRGPSVVAAARPLPRGARISAADLKLKPADSSQKKKTFQGIEELVGQETMRSLVAGQVITAELVRRPILVHRRDMVTVYVRSPGVQVRTTGRAREDGSLGDLVSVESLQDRKTYFARVSGFQEVEVFAHAPVARSNNPLAVAPARQDAAGESRDARSLSGSAGAVRSRRNVQGGSNRPARLSDRAFNSAAPRGQ